MAQVRKTNKRHRAADRPIESAKEDLLGRAEFAANLAEDIRGWRGKDAFVIGLYGSWGCGKSSIKNLICAKIQKGRSPLKVMEFNPWQLSGTGSILPAFFAELAIMLRHADKSVDGQERADRMSRYASRLGLAGTVLKITGTTLSTFGVPMANVLTAIGEKAKEGAEVAKEGADALGGTKADKSLSELKAELTSSLKKLTHPILVVIDDIDRLASSEIREVFQLVKINADFPNLIYLLLCDRAIVAEALDEISGKRGNEFLEKIIQVGYDVPRMSVRSMEKILFAGLDDLLGRTGVMNRWDRERWVKVYQLGLSRYFQTLRHVYRFLSSLDFHVRHFQRDDGFEVNPIDLIALEALRVFEPLVYSRLAGAKQILTRQADTPYEHIQQTIVDVAIDQMLSTLNDQQRDQVRSNLALIFPPINDCYDDKNSLSPERPEWLRNARVCHPSLFDKYFSLIVPEDELSQVCFDRLLSAAANRVHFVTECEALRHRGLLKLAFERLDAYPGEIPQVVLPELIPALFDVFEITPKETFNDTWFSIDIYAVAFRIICVALLREKDISHRLHLLQEAFDSSEAVFLPAELVAWDEAVHRADDGRQSLLSENDLIPFRSKCLVRLRALAKSGKFRAHVRSGALFWRWKAWAPQELRQWIEQECTSSDAALWLVSVLMASSTSSSGTQYYLKTSSLCGLMEFDHLKSLLANVDENALSETQLFAFQAFREAEKRQEQGKAESSGLDLDDSD